MDRIAWIMGLLIGIAFVLLTPPFESPDEHCHFLRAYHCSEGTLYAQKNQASTGDLLPDSLLTVSRFRGSWPWSDKTFSIALKPDRREYLAFSNTAIYSPVPYLPASLAIAAGRVVRLPPMALLYVARLANVVAYVALMVSALRYMPVQKWTLFLIAMMPMSMFLAGSLSADVITNGAAFLVIAMVLHDALQAQRLTRRHLATLLLWSVVVALSKQAYCLLPLLFIIVPAWKLGGRWQWRLATSTLVGIPILLCLAWSLSVNSLYAPLRAGVDPPAQLHYLLTHPQEYATVFFHRMVQPDVYYYLVGVLGWYTVFLPQPVYAIYWLALGTTAVLDAEESPFSSVGIRAVAAALFVLETVVVTTLIYMSWNAVGANRLEGIQPRYLIPVLPLAFLPLEGLAGRIVQRWPTARSILSRANRSWGPSLAGTTVAVAAVASIYSMVATYYR